MSSIHCVHLGYTMKLNVHQNRQSLRMDTKTISEVVLKVGKVPGHCFPLISYLEAKV